MQNVEAPGNMHFQIESRSLGERVIFNTRLIRARTSEGAIRTYARREGADVLSCIQSRASAEAIATLRRRDDLLLVRAAPK